MKPWAETLSRRVCLADMAFPCSMSQVCFWHTQSLTLLPGPSHLLQVDWLEPLIGKQALICQWHMLGRTLSSDPEDKCDTSRGEKQYALLPGLP